MTEHPNAEKARRGYAAFAEQDMATLGELMADDVVWHMPGSNPLSGDYKGREEVFGFFMRVFQETQGTFAVQVHDILANDDHIVVLARVSGDRNGRHHEQNAVHVYHPDADGRVREFWQLGEDTAATDEFWS